MKRTFRILGTTLIGGMVFLIPAVVLVVIVGKALKFTSRIVRPIASWFPVQSVGGLAVASLLAIALVLLICFAAGLWARKSLGFGIVRWLDEKLQDFVPRYTVIKAMAHGFGGDSGRSRLNVVLAKFDDNAQIAFEIERSKSGLVSLFLPGSPDPWSGTVVHMPAERVEPLDAEFSAVVKSMKGIGTGTAAILDSASATSKKDASL